MIEKKLNGKVKIEVLPKSPRAAAKCKTVLWFPSRHCSRRDSMLEYFFITSSVFLSILTLRTSKNSCIYGKLLSVTVWNKTFMNFLFFSKSSFSAIFLYFLIKINKFDKRNILIYKKSEFFRSI